MIVLHYSNMIYVTVEGKAKVLNDAVKKMPDNNFVYKDKLPYSAAVKNPNSNSVITRPKDSSQTCGNINPVEISLNVSKIKNVRDGGLLW